MSRHAQAGLITLTILNSNPSGSRVVLIKTKELIAYDQHPGFTRLWLSGRKQLDVKESTEEIDRRVRRAASFLSLST